jgi:hypothetical protein
MLLCCKYSCTLTVFPLVARAWYGPLSCITGAPTILVPPLYALNDWYTSYGEGPWEFSWIGRVTRRCFSNGAIHGGVVEPQSCGNSRLHESIQQAIAQPTIPTLRACDGVVHQFAATVPPMRPNLSCQFLDFAAHRFLDNLFTPPRERHMKGNAPLPRSLSGTKSLLLGPGPPWSVSLSNFAD